jgi:hypothetical protein
MHFLQGNVNPIATNRQSNCNESSSHFGNLPIAPCLIARFLPGRLEAMRQREGQERSPTADLSA